MTNAFWDTRRRAFRYKYSYYLDLASSSETVKDFVRAIDFGNMRKGFGYKNRSWIDLAKLFETVQNFMRAIELGKVRRIQIQN